MATIAIVDDEKDLLTLLERYLAEEGYAVKTFESGSRRSRPSGTLSISVCSISCSAGRSSDSTSYA